MPKITPIAAVAYAHCCDMLCEGYSQAEVEAVRTLFERTIGESDPKAGIFAPIVETSWEDLEFADPADAVCEHCGATREISAAPRPSYQHFGFARDALVKMPKFDANVRNTEADEAAATAAAEQNRRLAEMEARIAGLLAQVEGSAGGSGAAA